MTGTRGLWKWGKFPLQSPIHECNLPGPSLNKFV